MIILDENRSNPLYVQIYQQIREQIISGRLAVGVKLPSYRKMAQELGVSRNTVEMAYQQLLSEGYLDSIPACGFFVTNIEKEVLQAGVQKVSANKLYIGNEQEQRIKPCRANIRYDFRYGQLAPADFPYNLWRKLTIQCLRDEGKNIMSYREGQGELNLRIQIINYLNKFRGVDCNPEQVVVCAGTQHCLELLCHILKEQNHQTVAFEEPGYDGVRAVLINHKFNVLPISVENDGINIGQLEQTSSTAVYVTPSHQFPLGSIMPIAKRLRLIDWAQKNNGIIIEDDYDANLRYHGKPIPSLQGIDSHRNVAYLGTFSKTLSPSIRVSYVVLPLPWINIYQQKFNFYDVSVPYLTQYVLEKYISEGHWERHLRKMSASYRKKHDTLVQSLRDLMKNNIAISGRNAGLHLVLKVNNGMTERELIQSAEGHGVKVYPVSRFWAQADKYTDDMVLLGFSSLSTMEIYEGVRLLAKTWGVSP